jgi:DGQHR domain-containing protein
LYFSKERIEFGTTDRLRYSKLWFIDIATYNYFVNLSKCIKKSFRFEILRFLGINYHDFGPVSAGSGSPLALRDVSIIYPNDVTGLNNGVGIVSFMMSPLEIIKSSYVLRKDNWEEKIGLYQRLLTEKRIKKIRKFVVEKKRTFFNNIIVGLPDDVSLFHGETQIRLEDLDRYENCSMKLAPGFNTLSIIDGQHRVYAYYENTIADTEEVEVAGLRDKLNLLVTGILFPRDWNDLERRKFQSDIFLEINKNSKNVDRDLLIHIESTKEPFSPLSIARMVLARMNDTSPFENKFQLSLVEKAPIKVASIIQFALSSLVNPKIEANGLYRYWLPSGGIQKPLQLNNEILLREYVNFCTATLNQYFNSIISKYKTSWEDPKTAFLRIVSINGFIIGLHHSLKLTDGIKDYSFYKSLFENSTIDFSKERFPYSGSRYSQFASSVIDPLFCEKCENKYVSLMNIQNDEKIHFVDNDEIVLTKKEQNLFLFDEKMYSLYDITKIIKRTRFLDKPAGTYWIIRDSTLHTMFESATF